MQNPIRFDPFTYLYFTIRTSGGVLVAGVRHASRGMILANNQEKNQGTWSTTPLSRWCLIGAPKTNVVLVYSY
jgi:hypothetical protein